MGNAGRVLMIPKGDYNAATTYEMLDCVYYNGRSYVCKQTSTGNAPTNTTYWQALTGDASAEIQALTNYVAENNVKNLFNIYGEKASQNVTSVTIESNGFRLVQSTVETFKNLQMWLRGLKKNTDYVFYTNCTITSGHPLVLIDNSSGTSVGRLNPPTAGANVLNFNTGNDTDFKFYFYCVTGTSETGEVLYADIMVCEKAVFDTEYQPYAKTNVELTQDVSWLTSAKTYYDANTDPTVKQNHYNVAKYFYDFIKPGESHTVIIRYAGGYYDTMILSRDNGTGLFCVDFCHADGLGKILYFRYNGTSDTFTDLFSVT